MATKKSSTTATTTTTTDSNTWAAVRAASDAFVAKGIAEGPGTDGKNGFGPDELEALLGACEYTRLFRSAPLRQGYSRSVKGVKDKAKGTWAHLTYLTSWSALKAEYAKKEYSVPNVVLVDWSCVDSASLQRLRIEEKFPRIGSFKPVFLAILQAQPEDKELFVAPKIAVVGSFRGADGYAPLNAAGAPEMVLLVGAVKLTQDRYVRGTLGMALPPMAKVTQDVVKNTAVAAESVPDFS